MRRIAFRSSKSFSSRSIRSPPSIRQSLCPPHRRSQHARRAFHASSKLLVIKPFLLADIGEGIRECEVIQWFVEPEARVEQFDKLCEVQSDKASVEITSRFDGVIKKLHYEAGDMAIVGKPLVDIDIQSQISPEDEAVITPPAQQAGSPSDAQQPQKALEQAFQQTTDNSPLQDVAASSAAALRKHATLATPAVRHLTKELKVDLADVPGTGKEGRVLKEDVHKFARGRDQPDTRPESSAPPTDQVLQTESSISLTPIQAQMFKTMTQSLGIPHFLYSDEVNLDALTSLRKRLTKHLPASSSEPLPKLTYMPFIIKAVSLALNDYPLLNARVEAASDGSKPRLMMRAQHNIGVAMATPQGLLVPNIKHVASLSIPAIAARLAALQALASAGKLSSADLSGGTITVSNIGNVGGTVVAPVLVSSEVAILGVGRARTTPAFDEHDNLVKRLVGHFSWSADHRVVDGAMMASMADRVRCLVEEPDAMLAALR